MSKRRPNNTNDTIHKGDIIYHRSRKMRCLVLGVSKCKCPAWKCLVPCSWIKGNLLIIGLSKDVDKYLPGFHMFEVLKVGV